MTDVRRFNTGLIYFIVLIALTLVRVIFALDIGKHWTDNENDIIYTIISQIICMGLLPFGLYIFLVIRKEKRSSFDIFKDFAYTMPSVKVVLIAFVSGIIFYYLTFGIASIWTGIITFFGYTGISSPGTIYTKPEELILWLFIIAVLPGVFEELTHRGLLINTYLKSSEEEAVIFSALLFGLMHQDIRQFGYAIAGGVILAYFFVKSRSILPPMIMHFTNNALNTIMDYSSQTGGLMGKIQDKFFGLFDNIFMILILMVTWIVAAFILFFLLISVDIITAQKNGTNPTWKIHFNYKKFKFNKDDTFLYAAIILGGVTTLFSYIWSVMR